ncbi:MAG: hypothetical protein JXB85_05820 [Anaerolineales bacterium]|nr:hypothetical protein [Anaerolineales bacterium]
MRLLSMLAGAVLLLLTACGGGTETTADPGAFYTQAVETAYAQLTQTAQAQPPIPTVTPEPSPTATLDPDATNDDAPAATRDPNATAGPTATPVTPIGLRPTATTQSCDNYLFLGDVTIPDGTIMDPGVWMDKTWEIQNAGPCNWNSNYELVYAYGNVDAWAATLPVGLAFDVPWGDTIQITVSLEVPTEPGNYFAAFVLRNDQGINFGITLPLTVSIVVPGTPEP